MDYFSTEKVKWVKERLRELMGANTFGIVPNSGGLKLVVATHRLSRLPTIVGCQIGTSGQPTQWQSCTIYDTGQVYHITCDQPEKLIDCIRQALQSAA